MGACCDIDNIFASRIPRTGNPKDVTIGAKYFEVKSRENALEEPFYESPAMPITSHLWVRFLVNSCAIYKDLGQQTGRGLGFNCDLRTLWPICYGYRSEHPKRIACVSMSQYGTEPICLMAWHISRDHCCAIRTCLNNRFSSPLILSPLGNERSLRKCVCESDIPDPTFLLSARL